MKRTFWYRELPLFLLIAGFVITVAAWQGHPPQTKLPATDTVPDRHRKIKDIDEALEDLEKSRADMERSLKDVDWQKMHEKIETNVKNAHIDAEKIKAEVAEAMKVVDVEKIQAEVRNALKEVDAEKIKTEVEKALKEVDVSKINMEVEKAMKTVDAEKIRADIDASIAKVDWNKINAEIEKVSKIDMEKIESDLKKMGPEMENTLQEARESMEKAKTELKAYKGLIDGLSQEGLIDKKGNYTIEYKNGDLIINGKKQTSELVKKYNDFLQGKKNFTIRKDENGFNIDND